MIDSVENDKTANWFDGVRNIGLQVLRQPGVTGDEVGGHVRIGTVDAGQEFLEKIAPPAFDKQNSGKGRNAAAEKVAQLLLFHVAQDSVLP